MPPKHKLEDLEYEWSDVIDTLKGLDADDASTVLAFLGNEAGVNELKLKRKRIALLPSFSSEKWADIAGELDLPARIKDLHLDHFSPPSCILPSSLQKRMFMGCWDAMEVYQEKLSQTRNAARLKLLEPVTQIFLSKQLCTEETLVVGSHPCFIRRQSHGST